MTAIREEQSYVLGGVLDKAWAEAEDLQALTNRLREKPSALVTAVQEARP